MRCTQNMKRILLTVLLVTPMLAGAQVYRCKQANGTTSFQSEPCTGSNNGSLITVKPASGAGAEPGTQAPAAARSKQPSAPSAERSRAEQEQLEANQKIQAYNKSVRCNAARRQLDVVMSQRPIYSIDNKGERNYVSDDNRQEVLNAAQKRVNTECN